MDRPSKPLHIQVTFCSAADDLQFERKLRSEYEGTFSADVQSEFARIVPRLRMRVEALSLECSAAPAATWSWPSFISFVLRWSMRFQYLSDGFKSISSDPSRTWVDEVSSS
jgi:hypothetical protein